MKLRPFVILAEIAILCVGIIISPVLGVDEDALGGQAEQAGELQEALTQYVSALQSTSQGSAKDLDLRKKIIKLAQRMQPPPAIPEEAHRHMVRGRAAVKAANDRQGFQRAAKEFKEALRLAPWVADAYYNLGVLLDKAGKYDEAIRSLELYLFAAPDAQDAGDVKDLIYEVEYRQEEAKRVKEAETRKLNEFDGVWRHDTDYGIKDWQITVTNTRFTARCLKYIHKENEKLNGCAWFNIPYEFSGIVNGRELSGTWSTHPSLPPGMKMHNDLYLSLLSPQELAIKALLSADGKKLNVHYFRYGILYGDRTRWTQGSWVKQTWIRAK